MILSPTFERAQLRTHPRNTLLDLLYQFPRGGVQFPIRLGKVTKVVRGGRLDKTTGAAHARSAEHMDLNGG